MIGLILAAAGSGSRFQGDVPKQFTRFRGKPLYILALEPFTALIDQAVLVVPDAWMSTASSEIRRFERPERFLVESGAHHRQDSVYRGLSRLPREIRIVLVHDAARPFVSPELIGRVLEGAQRYRACIPVIPVRDTVKEVEADRVVSTLDRSRLRLVQTPQAFDGDLLRSAFQKARTENFYATDEASLIEYLNQPVHVVEGESRNVKVTWQEDLFMGGGTAAGGDC